MNHVYYLKDYLNYIKSGMIMRLIPAHSLFANRRQLKGYKWMLTIYIALGATKMAEFKHSIQMCYRKIIKINNRGSTDLLE